MPPSLFHDAVFIGGSPAGLMAAGLLRRSGHEVLWLGQGAGGPSYHSEGMELAVRPDWLPPYGYARELDAVLQELGVEDPVHRLSGHPAQQQFQLATPRERIDLFTEYDALAAELERARLPEMGEALSIIRRLESQRQRVDEMLSLAARQMGEGRIADARLRSRAQALERTTEQPESWPWLLKVLAAASRFFGHLEPGRLPHWATGRWVLGLLGGLRQVSNLQGLLLDSMKKSGCGLQAEQSAGDVSVDGKNILLLHAEAEHRCRCLVCGLRVEQVSELISLGKLRRHFPRALAAVRRTGALFALNLVLPEKAIPLGMAHKVLLVPRPEQPLDEDNLLLLCRQPVSGRKGREQIQIFCRVSVEKRPFGRAALGPLQQRMIESVSLLLPFLKESMELLASPFWGGRGGDDPYPDVWGLHPMFEIEGTLTAGFSDALVRSVPRQLVLAGPELCPALGLEGAALAARFIARRIERLVHRRRFVRPPAMAVTPGGR